MDGGILVPCPGMELTPPEVEVQPLNHWTTNLEGSPLNCFLVLVDTLMVFLLDVSLDRDRALKGARAGTFLALSVY